MVMCSARLARLLSLAESLAPSVPRRDRSSALEISARRSAQVHCLGRLAISTPPMPTSKTPRRLRATADHGSVLRALGHNRNFAAVGCERVPRVNGSSLGLEVATPNLAGAPGVRDRASGHYELVGLDRLIGPSGRVLGSSSSKCPVLSRSRRTYGLTLKGAECPK